MMSWVIDPPQVNLMFTPKLFDLAGGCSNAAAIVAFAQKYQQNA